MEKKTLTLAFIAGFAGNAILAAMTQSAVGFSIFALLTLILSCYMLYQDWVAGVNAEESGWPAVAAFVAGLMSYSINLRLHHPDIGNVIFPVLILLGFALWGAYKVMLTPQDSES